MSESSAAATTDAVLSTPSKYGYSAPGLGLTMVGPAVRADQLGEGPTGGGLVLSAVAVGTLLGTALMVGRRLTAAAGSRAAGHRRRRWRLGDARGDADPGSERRRRSPGRPQTGC